MAKRILRRIIMVVTIAAALVFVLDYSGSGAAGVVGSVAVMVLSFLI